MVGKKKERKKKKKKREGVVRGWWGKKRKEKRKKKRGTGTEGEREKKIEKIRYFRSCEKNKYIKKWNSKVKIGSLV